MIAFVQGKLQYRDGENIVINVGGIGYHVVIPAKLVAALPPLGENIAVHTYFHLREDEASLFGFLQQDDLHLFKLLLSVSGIGPRVALNIVGATDHNSLMQAILAEDLAYLMKMPGIGKKTAQRLILELKIKWPIITGRREMGGRRRLSQGRIPFSEMLSMVFLVLATAAKRLLLSW